MKSASKAATHQVRAARISDVPRLTETFKKAVTAHFDYLSPDYRNTVLRQNRATRIALSVIKPSRVILLAVQNKAILGYAFGSLPFDGRAQLYWLYVDPNARGKNIGLSLLSKMLQTVENKGAEQLQLVTYRYTPYYARQGFKPVSKIMLGGVEQDIMRFEFK